MRLQRNEGGVGIFGLADLANVWFCFSVFALSEAAVFRLWGLPRFAGFLEFSLWFSVFVNNNGGFSGFLSTAFYGFSGFAKEVTSRSRAKTGVIPKTIYIAFHPIF